MFNTPAARGLYIISLIITICASREGIHIPPDTAYAFSMVILGRTV